MKPVLDRLNVDTDVDVKYFASEAITGIAGTDGQTMKVEPEPVKPDVV